MGCISSAFLAGCPLRLEMCPAKMARWSLRSPEHIKEMQRRVETRDSQGDELLAPR